MELAPCNRKNMGTGVRKPCLASTQPLALCATLEGAWPSLPHEKPLKQHPGKASQRRWDLSWDLSDKKEPGIEWSGKRACQAEEIAIAKARGQEHAQSVWETKRRRMELGCHGQQKAWGPTALGGLVMLANCWKAWSTHGGHGLNNILKYCSDYCSGNSVGSKGGKQRG